MPSKSKSQQRLMNAAAHNKEFADKVGVPQEVAKEYVAEDRKAGDRKLPETMNKNKK